MLHLPRQVERFELIATTQKNAKTAVLHLPFFPIVLILTNKLWDIYLHQNQFQKVILTK